MEHRREAETKSISDSRDAAIETQDGRIVAGDSRAVAEIADDAFSRVAGAPAIPGNSVRVLKNAAENYPAWLDAIAAAEQYIHFESYIIHEDEQGELFAEALIKKAAEGVRVRLIYDWLGGFGKTSPKFWR